MEEERYVVSTAVLSLHFLFSKPALMPTPVFEGLKIHSHTALFFFCCFLFLRGLPGWYILCQRACGGVYRVDRERLQASDEAQEVRGRPERTGAGRKKRQQMLFWEQTRPDPEMT